jgi:riboflavin synthase
MFTGIVQETGRIQSIRPASQSIRLILEARLAARGLKVGDSLAVNGCCLTVVRLSSRAGKKQIHFDLLRETWERTNLQFAAPGSKVNLEPALASGDPLGGHFVTGHVDGMGRVTRFEPAGKDYVLEIEPPVALMRYLVFKGSVAVDGISLTVAYVSRKRFRIWIIPHTWKVTALRERRPGDWVNLETDLLGKYVERFLRLKKV